MAVAEPGGAERSDGSAGLDRDCCCQDGRDGRCAALLLCPREKGSCREAWCAAEAETGVTAMAGEGESRAEAGEAKRAVAGDMPG